MIFRKYIDYLQSKYGEEPLPQSPTSGVRLQFDETGVFIEGYTEETTGREFFQIGRFWFHRGHPEVRFKGRFTYCYGDGAIQAFERAAGRNFLSEMKIGDL